MRLVEIELFPTVLLQNTHTRERIIFLVVKIDDIGIVCSSTLIENKIQKVLLSYRRANKKTDHSEIKIAYSHNYIYFQSLVKHHFTLHVLEITNVP